jgi:hypothetical protein
MAEAPRRPPPWRVDIPGGHVVRDANGQALAYLYSRANEAEAHRGAPRLRALTLFRMVKSRQLRYLVACAQGGARRRC